MSTSDLCEKVSDGLLHSAKERDRRVVVHQCESIVQVLRFKPDTSIDFVIFAYDGRITNILNEVEENIGLIDEHYSITSRTILIHCNGLPNIRCPSFDRARSLCDKYNLRFMSANVFDPDNCKLLAKRILNLAEVILGFNSGIPTII